MRQGAIEQFRIGKPIAQPGFQHLMLPAFCVH
jgi:hypothetical protein